MFNYILFGIYMMVLLFLTGFLVIFIIHIRDYLQYSKYIKGVLRIYLLTLIIIAVFGGFKILTGNTPTLQGTGAPTPIKNY